MIKKLARKPPPSSWLRKYLYAPQIPRTTAYASSALAAKPCREPSAPVKLRAGRGSSSRRSRDLLAEVIDCEAQAFLQIDAGPPAEIAARPRVVQGDAENVAFAPGSVVGGRLV